MARPCTICNHPNRNDIENAVLENKTLTEIAKRYDIKVPALFRHRQNHMTREAVEAIQAAGQGMLPLPQVVSPEKAERIARHIDAADQMIKLNEESWRIYERAVQSGGLKLQLMAIDALHKNIDLMAKLSLFARMDKNLEERLGSRRLSDALEDLIERTKEAVVAQ